MAVVVAVHIVMAVYMVVLVGVMDVGVGVRVGMGMAVDQITVPVLVAMDVAVWMGVLQGDGVFHHEHRSQQENCQGDIKLQAGMLSQQQHTECDTEEWGNGIVGTGLRRTQIFLCPDIKGNAQPIGDKAQQHNAGTPDQAGPGLAEQYGNDQTAQAGKAPFDCGDLCRAFAA